MEGERREGKREKGRREIERYGGREKGRREGGKEGQKRQATLPFNTPRVATGPSATQKRLITAVTL